MPIGVVDDSAFERELAILLPKEINNETIIKPEILDEVTSLDETIGTIVERAPAGRPEGKLNTPDCIRKVIAEEAIKGASNRELAELFNVGPQVPSVYKNGSTSQATYNDKSPSLNNHVKRVKENLVKKAARKMNEAFDNLTPEKISEESARDIAGIAKDMSAIIKNLSPDEDEGQDKGVQFVFFAPQVRREEEYQVIDISANP